MKVLLTQSEKEKLFDGFEDFGKTYIQIVDRVFSRNNYIKIYA